MLGLAPGGLAEAGFACRLPICMFIAMEVLDALDYAHNAKDVEGKPMHWFIANISPSNVFHRPTR